MSFAKNRIPNRKEFGDICKRGQTFFESGRCLKLAKNGLNKTRFGVSVGIKFSPLASQRNLIRRQLKAIFQSEINNLGLGWDLIVILGKGGVVKNGKNNNQYQWEHKTFVSLAKKAGIYKKNNQ